MEIRNGVLVNVTNDDINDVGMLVIPYGVTQIDAGVFRCCEIKNISGFDVCVGPDDRMKSSSISTVDDAVYSAACTFFDKVREEYSINHSKHHITPRTLSEIPCNSIKPETADTTSNKCIKTKPYAIALIDIVEDLLDENCISLPSPDREGVDGEAAIYGETFDYLNNKFTDVLLNLIIESRCDDNFEINTLDY